MPNNMIKVKLSKYICVLEKKDKVILFNTLYGFIDELSIDIFELLKTEQFSKLDESTFEALCGRFYLISPDVNEKNYLIQLKQEFDEVRSQIKRIFISFSYSCNLKCTYCFEQEMRKINDMNEEHLEDILEYLNSNLGTKDIEIVMYGGEPLLLKNYSMIEKVFQYAELNKVKVRIITNGINIVPFITVLRKYNKCLNYLLITLDGNKEVHDMTRKFASGEGSFNIIVDNLLLLKKNQIPFELRMNIGIHNVHFLEQLENFEIFKSEIINVHIVENNKNSYTIKDTMEEKDINDVLLYIYQLSQKRSNIRLHHAFFNHLVKTLLSENIVYPAFDSCGLENIYLFDSTDLIYTCTESCGNSSYIRGNIGNRAVELRDYSFMKDERCLECEISPICGGGCNMKRSHRKTSKCLIKENQLELIRRFVDNLLE